MTIADFYAEITVRLARKAAKYHDKHLTELALRTAYLAFFHDIITAEEWCIARGMIHKYASANCVDFI